MVNRISNVNFGANLQIYRGSKKLMSNVCIDELKNRAKDIGSDSNRIIIGLFEKKDNITGAPITYISAARHDFFIKEPAKAIENMAEFTGPLDSGEQNVFKTIENYLNNIKSSLLNQA